MSGYKAGYSEAHSPYYAQGLADGLADRARGKLDPPQPPANYDHSKAQSVMYNKGYGDAFMHR